MEKFIECAGWKQTSCDDGPGMRSVLFLQGCSMKCHGCHNKQVQQKGDGVVINLEELTELCYMVDYIKYGSFVEKLKSADIHYVGSVNQRIYKKDITGRWKELDIRINV